MDMQISYADLDAEERYALEVAILDADIKELGSRLFPGFSDSTYYRYHSRGQEKLKQKGILEHNNSPASLAFDILPTDIARGQLTRLVERYRQVKADRSEEFKTRWHLQDEKIDLEKEVQTLKNTIATLQSELLQKNEKYQLLENFAKKFSETAFHVDEKLVTALTALNLIEPAIKKKLMELGEEIPDKANFGQLYENLRKVLAEKEKRRLKKGLISPQQFYALRSTIDHAAYEVEEIGREELELVVNQSLKIVKEIYGKQ